MSTTETPNAAGTPELYEKRWWALGTLCLSLLIVIIGNTTLNVVMPVLSKRLNATNSQMQWVVAIYSLVFAGLLFSSGALGDRFGRKGALQIGLGIFFVASLLASQSTTMTQLILCRGLMGVGAAFIMPSTLSTVMPAAFAVNVTTQGLPLSNASSVARPLRISPSRLQECALPPIASMSNVVAPFFARTTLSTPQPPSVT